MSTDQAIAAIEVLTKLLSANIFFKDETYERIIKKLDYLLDLL